ncbi:uncharacterized protein UV8b_01776 [Ustilaginoidea virens]|uniref:Beta-lactamase-related domain-containing protein n=1 Tax=Ustilaginoidea virens TaxID=1159556 RepID=A0A8E5HLN1_USTVR|nr:uncharacterized protein UV8b_01776 [Ustilaginoidea virens]QUC17535.1 hypothetical protein UV8b_01776 [Ustilaginoidea virens]
MENGEIKSRLEMRRPDAEEIMRAGRCLGAAIAVIHDGRLLHIECIGVRNVAQQLPVNPFTVFPCAALTKTVIAAAVAQCVDEGNLSWDDRLEALLPGIFPRAPLFRQMTPVDCLAQRPRINHPQNWVATGSSDETNSLQQFETFRNSPIYRGVGYDISGMLLRQLRGIPCPAVLDSRIFQPLSMLRTTTQPGRNEEGRETNISQTYGALMARGQYVKVEPSVISGDFAGGPDASMYSCMSDMVRLYSRFLEDYAYQLQNNTTETPGSPLKQVPFMLLPRAAMSEAYAHRESSGLGWIRVQTPAPMGVGGLNPRIMHPRPMPDVATGHPTQYILYNQGSRSGNLAAVSLVPSTKGAIIVLTNTLGLNDVADWLGQMYLEAYLGVAKKNDYVRLARETAEKATQWNPQTMVNLLNNRRAGRAHRDLIDYTGQYQNDALTMKIYIFIDSRDNTTLRAEFRIHEATEEIYLLTHFRDDVFTFVYCRNHLIRRGRFTYEDAEFFKLAFGCNDTCSRICVIKWRHNGSLSEPEVFKRQSIRRG